MARRKAEEEPLKALVFADGCGAEDSALAAGMPLLSCPILSWQLAALARYGVAEAVVLSSRPVDVTYRDPLGRLNVTLLSSASWRGEGDAIRDVEGRDGLCPVDDFVLVRRGAVFNVNVQALVAAHKKRRDADRNWLITSVFQRGAGSAAEGLVVGVESASGTLVKYVERLNCDGVSVDVFSESAGLVKGSSIEVRSDVMDIGLDVCAPEFLVEFRENFFYDNVRAYVREKLDGGEAEVFGNRMYAHFVDSAQGEYATRIASLASLTQATADLLNGWMYPLSVKLVSALRKVSICSLQSGTCSQRENGDVVIGEDVTIGEGARVSSSVLGDGVVVGENAELQSCIVLNGARIGAGGRAVRSVIGEKCYLGASCELPEGSFLDTGVKIGDDFGGLKSHSFVTTRNVSDFTEEDDESDDAVDDGDDEGKAERMESGLDEWQAVEVGEGGVGRIICPETSSIADPFLFSRDAPTVLFESDSEDELEERDDDNEDDANGAGNGTSDSEDEGLGTIRSGMRGASLEEDVDAEADRVRLAKFNDEMLETIERAIRDDAALDTTSLEVNSLKLVYNCSFAETLIGLVGGVAIAVERTSPGPSELYSGLFRTLRAYASLITKFNSANDTSLHVQVAKGLAMLIEGNATLLMYVFKAMYEQDMLEEEGILGWAESERALVACGRKDGATLTTLEPLLSWLEQSEEESEDE